VVKLCYVLYLQTSEIQAKRSLRFLVSFHLLGSSCSFYRCIAIHGRFWIRKWSVSIHQNDRESWIFCHNTVAAYLWAATVLWQNLQYNLVQEYNTNVSNRCWIAEKWKFLRIPFEFVPLWICLVFNIIMFVIIQRMVQRKAGLRRMALFPLMFAICWSVGTITWIIELCVPNSRPIYVFFVFHSVLGYLQGNIQ
jgi:hypothetical protein